MRRSVEAASLSTTDRRVAFGSLVRYFLYLGSLGFGGPVALAGFMHRDLVPVEKEGWVSEEEYALALALAQIMPGPPCCGDSRSRNRSSWWQRRQSAS